MGVFALFTVFSAGYVGWEEFHNPENEGSYATFLAMGHAASPFVILSAGLAVIKVEVTAMTGDRPMEVGQCAEGIEGIHRCIAGRFRRPEPRRRALDYLRGLLSPLERKNGWHLAKQAGDAPPLTGCSACYPPIVGMPTWFAMT